MGPSVGDCSGCGQSWAPIGGTSSRRGAGCVSSPLPAPPGSRGWTFWAALGMEGSSQIHRCPDPEPLRVLTWRVWVVSPAPGRTALCVSAFLVASGGGGGGEAGARNASWALLPVGDSVCSRAWRGWARGFRQGLGSLGPQEGARLRPLCPARLRGWDSSRDTYKPVTLYPVHTNVRLGHK